MAAKNRIKKRGKVRHKIIKWYLGKKIPFLKQNY